MSNSADQSSIRYFLIFSVSGEPTMMCFFYTFTSYPVMLLDEKQSLRIIYVFRVKLDQVLPRICGYIKKVTKIYMQSG